MHKNAFWIGFLLIVVAASLWFLVKLGYEMMDYLQLTHMAEAQVEYWNVEEIKKDSYQIRANFSFEHEGKTYQATDDVGTPLKNPWAAKKKIETLSKRNWQVWFNPKNPHKAHLEKNFPFKSALSVLVLLALVLYFMFLGFYVGGRGGGRSKKSE